jgi:hypothetical protein
MRQVSGSPECGVVAMFPTSKSRHTGYNAGIGWWSNGFGTGAPSASRAIIHVHKKDWQTVRIYAADDGNVYFFLNGGLEKVVKDNKFTSGPIRLGHGCRDFEYRNIVVKGGDGAKSPPSRTWKSNFGLFAYMFDGCCRGGPAKTWKVIGKLDTIECQHRCSLDRRCNAVEVNGCNGDPLCGGQCLHFYGDGAGPITNGRCVVSGDQVCYKKNRLPFINLEQLKKAAVILGPGMSQKNPKSFIDMNPSPSSYPVSPTGSSKSCADPRYVTVDLGNFYEVQSATIWNYYADGRRYCGQKIALSKTGVFAGEEDVVWNPADPANLPPGSPPETPARSYGPFERKQGNHHVWTPAVARFVRYYSARSDKNTGVHMVEIDIYGTVSAHLAR